MSKLRIIIGQGTATEVYRATLPDADSYDTIVIGPRGLWATLPGAHRMGQTPELLALPGQPVPRHTVATGTTVPGLGEFLDVHTYQQGLLALAQRNDTRPGTITGVQLGRGAENRIRLDQIKATRIEQGFRDGQLRVRTSDPRVSFLADQVIVATGIGPQRTPNPPGGIHGAPAVGLPFEQLQEGVDYLDAPPPYGQEVAVFGGSATAAWVAYEALQRARKLLWFTRPGGSEFRGCTLPGDRNYMVLQATQNLRLLADLYRIDYLPAKRVGTRVLRRPMVKLTLRPNAGPDKVCLVDQLIYSIGGDPAGPQSLQQLIAAPLRALLQPLRDNNRVISDGTGVLAIASPTRHLIIIGSATYNYTDGTLAKQSAPMRTLPTASQVPDGIAMIVSSMQAMNSHMPFKQDNRGNVLESNLNINLADRDQLAVYLAMFYPNLGPAAANEIVTRVIGLRSSGGNRAFGISEAEFETIIRQYAG